MGDWLYYQGGPTQDGVEYGTMGMVVGPAIKQNRNSKVSFRFPRDEGTDKHLSGREFKLHKLSRTKPVCLRISTPLAPCTSALP